MIPVISKQKQKTSALVELLVKWGNKLLPNNHTNELMNTKSQTGMRKEKFLHEYVSKGSFCWLGIQERLSQGMTSI